MSSRKANRNAPRRPTSRPAFRPGLECLEDRPVPSATHLVVIGQPTLITAGAGFNLVVWAEDASNHIDTSFNDNVSLALANNPGGATLGGDLSVTAVNGVATFSGLSLDNTGAGFTLQAS